MARDHLPAGKGEGGERTVREVGKRPSTSWEGRDDCQRSWEIRQETIYQLGRGRGKKLMQMGT